MGEAAGDTGLPVIDRHGTGTGTICGFGTRQLVSKAITTEGQVIDVFTAAGSPKPDISS